MSLRSILEALLLAVPLCAQPCAVHTIAGPPTTFAGEGQPAAAAQFYKLHGLAPDLSGNLYIADTGNNRIRRILASGVVETVAGTGADGFSGDGAHGRNAQLSSPEAALAANDGSVYISDTQNHRIRRLSLDGTIQTIAGTGQAGFSGDGGPALLAQIDSPRGLAMDSAGNLYFADSLNNRVRRIGTDGAIRTVAGNGLWGTCCSMQQLGLASDNTPALNTIVVSPTAIAIDSHNNLYVLDIGGGLIRINAQGFAQPLQYPFEMWTSISADSDDSLVLLGQAFVDQVLQRITTDGKLTDIAHGAFGTGAAVGSDGRIYVDMSDDTVGLVTPGSTRAVPLAGASVNGAASGDNGSALKATFRSPSAVAVTKDGSVYVADRYDNRVRRIGKDGIIRPFAGTGAFGSSGDGNPALQAQLAAPQALAVDGAGNLYIGESKGSGGRVRMVKPDGTIGTILGGGSTEVILPVPPSPSVLATSADISYPTVLAVGSDNTLFVLAFDSSARAAGVLHVTGDGRAIPIYRWTAQPLLTPVSMTVDAAGNVYANGLIIAPNGAIRPDTNLPINFGPVRGATSDGIGNRYITNGGQFATSIGGQIAKVTKDGAHGTIFNADLKGFSGEIGLDSAAQDIGFASITADDAGNVYIADFTGRVRQVEAGSCPVMPQPVIRGFTTGWPRRSDPLYANLPWLAPGSLVSIYGDGIGPATPALATLDTQGFVSKQLSGVRVLINGVPAPLLYVSSSQINALAPFSVLRDHVLLEVERDGLKSDALRTTALPAALSVFPSAINEDGTLNSQANPGRPGSIVTIWVSGLGFTDPPSVDGRPAPLPLGRPILPVSIDLGASQPAEILYVGNAPNIVEGVMQINFRLPSQQLFSSGAVLTVGSDRTVFNLYY